MLVACSRIVRNTNSRSPGDAEIRCNISEFAVSRSSASSRSRRSRSDSLSARTVDALRRFGIALRLRALVSLLLALERRRIAHPKGLGLRRFAKSITAGNCGRWNGVQGSFARWHPKSSADAPTSAKCGPPHEDIQNARRIIGQGQGWIDRLEQALTTRGLL